MAGLIPQSFVDDVVARTDIVEIIDELVPLKRAGKDYMACCPFHGEKTPSFSVSRDKQFYYCFGCGVSGSVITFLMEYSRLDFPAAIEELASRLGVEVPREGGDAGPRTNTQPLLDALESAARWYRRQLRDHPNGPDAIGYLRERGLGGDTAKQYRLGFAPPGWDTCAGALGRGEADRRALIDAGVLAQRDDGSVYDRLRNRIVFPIRNPRGQVIGFGGRVLGDDSPKYLNSPETPVFHKGQSLYGLHEASRGIRERGYVIVVEGYMDVVSLAHNGFANAVATMGTAVTSEHLKRLFRVCSDVVFCFDGDAAGRRAAWKALEQALPVLGDADSARFCFLPDGEDPDSLSRSEGEQAFEARLEDASTLGTFLFDELRSGLDVSSIDGRSRLVERARPLLAQLRPGAFSALARSRLAELSRLPEAHIDAMVDGAPAKPGGGAAAASTQNGGKAGGDGVKRPSLVRRAITLLMHSPRLAHVVDASRIEPLELPGVDVLCELVRMAQALESPTTGTIVERVREHRHGPHLARLANEAAGLGDEPDSEFAACWDKLVTLTDEGRRRARLDSLSRLRIDEMSAEQRAEFLKLTRVRN